MRRILITTLSLYWTTAFAAASMEAAGAPHTMGSAMLAVVHLLVALLFLWAAACALGPRRDGGNDVRDVGRIAFAAAAAVLTAVAALDGGQELSGAAAVQLAALGATYLVIRAEEGEREPHVANCSRAAARHLAEGAAQGSMLTRPSRRGPDMPETDA